MDSRAEDCLWGQRLYTESVKVYEQNGIDSAHHYRCQRKAGVVDEGNATSAPTMLL